MNVLFDTNVVLDLLLDRDPFVIAAAQLFAHVEQGNIIGLLSATTIATVYYLATKKSGVEHTRKKLSELFKLFEIAPVNRLVLESAMKLPFTDFEDAVLYEAARYSGAQAVVTRDKIGFKKAQIPIYTSIELVKILKTNMQHDLKLLKA